MDELSEAEVEGEDEEASSRREARQRLRREAKVMPCSPHAFITGFSEPLASILLLTLQTPS